MTLYLELEENPKGTAQQKGESVIHGRIHHFEKANVRTQRAIYMKKIRQALDDLGRPIPHYEGPVAVNIVFWFSIKQKKKWGQWKTSKPDLDNSCKLLLDCISSEEFGLIDDDCQIAKLKLSKQYAESPAVQIDIWRLIQP